MSTITSTSKQTQSMSIWERYNSPIVWLLLVAYLGVATFLVTVVFPVQFVDRSQSGFFEAQGIIAIRVMGMIGVWLSMRTGFPNAWDSQVTNKQRMAIPIIVGLLLGSLFLATDLATDMSRLKQEQSNVPAMGGFAALLFCAMLQYGKAIVFSPQTFVSSEKRQTYGDDRWPDQIKNLHEAPTAADIHDLKPWIQNRYPQMPARVYVSTSDTLDMHHVSELADFSNIEIHRFPTGGHGLVTELRDNGLLENILDS